MRADLLKRLRRQALFSRRNRLLLLEAARELETVTADRDRYRNEVSTLMRKRVHHRRATGVWMERHRARIAKLQGALARENLYVKELQAEIRRHHQDFEKWEDMADKGAAQLNALRVSTEMCARLSARVAELEEELGR